MNYWLINGIGIQAVEITTALHKYGQWLRNKKGKPEVGHSGVIRWRRISKALYEHCVMMDEAYENREEESE